MNIIGNKFIFLGFSSALVILSIFSIGYFGLKQGIDFVGGTMWQVRLNSEEAKNAADLSKDLKDKAGLEDAIVISEETSQSFIIRLKEITEPEHEKYAVVLKNIYPNLEELSFESIGPAIGGELRSKAIWAFVFVIFGISLYIAFAFRKVSHPVSSWKYGIITLITLFHDAIIPAGLFALLGYLYNAEVDTNFVVAILVVMGFSVHDTIVVFDRVRENIRLEKNFRMDFNALVNRSVNETMARSINTSFTLVIVLVALYLFGGASLKYFVLTMLVGTIFGTYSSIFVASPLLTMWRKK